VTRSAWIAPEWTERLGAAGLTDAARLLAAPPDAGDLAGRWEPLTKPGLGGRERWRWTLPGTPAAVLYLKRYLHTPWRAQCDRLWRQARGHSRAWWEWWQGEDLTRRSVPAARAVAVAEELWAGWECRSAVLFPAVAGDGLDRAWAAAVAAGAPLTRGRARHAVVRSLARFVSAFHQTGTCHRDLYLCHVFAVLDPTAANPPRFTLIDLARTHRPRWRRMRWLLKDLAQLDSSTQSLDVTRTDRLRFLSAYLGLPRESPRTRWYARRVAARSARIARQVARRRARG